jgi:hypothetical protein
MSPDFEFSLGALRFDPGLVAVLASAAVIGMALYAGWRAARRLANSGSVRRWGVFGLNLLAGVAVVLLLLSPRVEHQADATVALITEGGASRATASLATTIPRSGPRYALGDFTDLANADLPGDPLTVAGQLTLRRPDLESVTVWGHGLDEAQWGGLPDDLAVRFDPPPLNGPTQAQWSPQLVLGQALTVSGVLRLEAMEAVARLELVDPAGLVVATASARSGQPFLVTATPRGAGALEYRLRVVRGESLIADDPVGVSVVQGWGARLLVVQSAPSFETRRFANWAADKGHSLVIHSRISRDRDLVQGVNLEAEAPLERTASMIADMDLVLMDGRRWADLPAAERAIFMAAVRSGLGLVLLADTELAAWLETPANTSLLGLALVPEPSREDAWPSWPGLIPEQPLPVAPWRLALTSARPLTRDEAGNLLEAWQPIGEGRVMVSLLRERSRWATSGEASTFARYWARLLRRVAREDASPRWLPPSADQRPRPRERLTLCATQGATSFSFASRDAVTEVGRVPLVTPATGASARCGVVWPTAPGWHVAQLFDPAGALQDELFLKVYGTDDWTAHRFERRQAATRARASIPGSAVAERRLVETPLSPWWAWSLLLLSAGALWTERRLFELG